VTFHNADTGFAVLKVKARGRRDLVPLVGHAASISAGEYNHAVGVSISDRTHGLQFKADVLKTTPRRIPRDGALPRIGNGVGIGSKLAERIVGKLGYVPLRSSRRTRAGSGRCPASVRLFAA
jgi:exodeoxyribonuclease V alpha subunit